MVTQKYMLTQTLTWYGFNLMLAMNSLEVYVEQKQRYAAKTTRDSVI